MHIAYKDALDHFLQALFAVNATYFPSRKRTKQYMDTFTKKPLNCYQRLLQVVKDSVCEEKIEASIKELRVLAEEVNELGTKEFKDIMD